MPRRVDRRIAPRPRPCLVAASLLLAGCAAENTEEACRVVRLATLPMQVVGGSPVVELAVGGRTGRFLLDTGSSGMMVTEAGFERLGLRYDLRIVGTSTSVGARALSRATEPAVLTAGGVALEPMTIMVVPSASALPLSGGVDGLLGTEALAAYDVDIDMPRRQLTLNRARRCALGPPPFDGPSTTVRAPPNTYRWLHVPVTVDGTPLSLVVDTGANRTYLNEQRIALAPAAAAADRRIPVNTAGPAPLTATLHRFDTVRIGGEERGGETRRGMTLAVGPLATGSDGLLGTDILRGRRVWLSFAGWAVTIQGRMAAE